MGALPPYPRKGAIPPWPLADKRGMASPPFNPPELEAQSLLNNETLKSLHAWGVKFLFIILMNADRVPLLEENEC